MNLKQAFIWRHKEKEHKFTWGRKQICKPVVMSIGVQVLVNMWRLFCPQVTSRYSYENIHKTSRDR